MREGYVVMNTSNCGNEIFGAYRTLKQAEKCLRRVVRVRFGRCPRDFDKLCEEPYINGGDDAYGIVWFEEPKGE